MSTFISLLRAHHDALMTASHAPVSPDMKRAIAAMECCQTEAAGWSQWYCRHCHHHDQSPLSCGHRLCPQCQHRTSATWLARQQAKLLPVHYFMITFTLPAELRGLARAQPKALYRIMFSVAASLLKDFAQRRHGGRSGFTAVLHTHSRRRDLHPHLHVMVPAGYYDPARRQWHKGPKRYLYPAAALAKVWRGRLLAAIHQHLQLYLPARLPAQWVVDCRPVGRGLPALKYLSRYLYRGVLPDRDIIGIDGDQVTFRYREGKTNHWQHRTLPIVRFLGLILQHALPKGLQRVRDYGLLHGSARTVRLIIQLLLMRLGWRGLPGEPATMTKASRSCPHCAQSMVCTGIIRTG
ncbi:IS91 family transposase, partial [Oceanisphaera sediminis]